MVTGKRQVFFVNVAQWPKNQSVKKNLPAPVTFYLYTGFQLKNDETITPVDFDAFSDNTLMQKVKDGDIGKMGLLFERYHQQLFRFMFNMTRQKELSEDMVQNTFLRLLKYPGGFKGSGEFRTWMYHVARNVLNDHFRKERNTPVKDVPEDFEAAEPEPYRTIEKNEELENLETAIQMLSVENRELIVMCRYQELKYNEIASILNITEGAVKVRVHRALGQLKTNFLSIEKR